MGRNERRRSRREEEEEKEEEGGGIGDWDLRRQKYPMSLDKLAVLG